ncbi:MAG TPA: class II glutamine amidotransferase [Gammaproteobacteria bacterium]|nr:class II glutamine amidotransferase [Gammaproteobacteria bacterium]
MCRLAAYLGPAISLQQFLIDPPHSLYRQSWEPRELKYAKLNADGFGFGWFGADGQPAAYTHSVPIWADGNLPALARTLQQALWVAEVRSATEGNPVHPLNTPPFCDGQRLFIHNGFITGFHRQVRPRMLQLLDPVISADIRGNTDSEYLFACLRQILLDEPDLQPVGAIKRLFVLIAGMVEDQPALLNFVVADAGCIVAARHALNHECPSLYYSISDPDFPGGQLVASERFSTDSGWQAVPEHHVLVLRQDRNPELLAL